MAAELQISEARLEGALRKHAGIYSLAAQELGCTRQNVQIRVTSSEYLKGVCKECDDRLKDIGRGQIVKLLSKGEPATVRWYADRKLREDGYGNSFDLGLSRELLDALKAGVGDDLDAIDKVLGALSS